MTALTAQTTPAKGIHRSRLFFGICLALVPTGASFALAAVQPPHRRRLALRTADGRGLRHSTAAFLHRLSHDPRSPATERSTAMDLDGYLDQLSAQFDDIHEARASGARVAPGNQALVLLGQFARLQRLFNRTTDYLQEY